MAENKVRFGIQNVYVAFLNADETDYGTPIRIPGARNLTTDPQGESNNWYADNIPFVTFNSNSGYTGSLELALIPDAVLAEMFGWTIDANGALVEDAEGVPKSFALLFEVKGDKKNRRNVFYNVSATRPGSNNQTQEESIDPNTETLNITMIPRTIQVSTGQGATVSKTVTKASMEPSTQGQAAYDAFFNAVYIPQLGTSSSGVQGA